MPDFIDPDLFKPDTYVEQGRETWQATHEGEADWCCRRIAYAEDTIAAKKALYAAEKEKLDKWLAKVTSKAEDDIGYFSGQLRKWHESQLRFKPTDDGWEKKEKNKSIPLPSGGRVSLRRGGESTVIDEDVFIPWAREHHSDWVRPKYEPEKALIKKAITVAENGAVVDPDGQVVPGVEIKQGEPSWKVETEA